ncbi:YciI family protein [Nonomuraea sp. NPDC050556]|uniref:YciI family protein n=1 Tax=Nonomuraea sp. NPDC050556 TaxID=3364369 RepID=UPI00378AF269
MWIIELTFTANDERLAARPAHRRLLEQLHGEGVVRLAGPLADDSGAVIVLDVADRDAVDRLIAADPYFTTPGVSVAKIRQWEPFLS